MNGLMLSYTPCGASWMEWFSDGKSGFFHICMKPAGHEGLHQEWVRGPDGKPGAEWGGE
jgi:hypothetical protein